VNKLFEIITKKIIYKCYSCEHTYCPWLTKTCPKCKAYLLEKHINVEVKLHSTVDRFHITIDKNGIKESEEKDESND